jgi:hypothetical protein
MINTRLLSCLAFIISLAACSSLLEATTSFRDGFDFSSVESYSTYGRNSSFGDSQNLSDTTRNTIELAIEQGFESSGFNYKTSQKADIIIAYHLLSNRIDDLDKYNQQVKYCSYCFRSGQASRAELLKELRSGSLILDIINPKNESSVWRSVYPLKFKEDDNSREMQEKISHAVNSMLRHYPRDKTIGLDTNAKREPA